MGKVCQVFRAAQTPMVFHDAFLCLYFFNRAHIAEQVFIIDFLIVLCLFAEHFFPSPIAPENHIYQKPQYGDKKQHQQPCPCACRISPLKKDDEASQKNVCHKCGKPKNSSPMQYTLQKNAPFPRHFDFLFIPQETVYSIPRRGATAREGKKIEKILFFPSIMSKTMLKY